MEKIMDDEREAKEEKEKIENESKPNISFFESYKNSNLYIFVSIGVFFFTILIVGANYYFNQSKLQIFNKMSWN